MLNFLNFKTTVLKFRGKLLFLIFNDSYYIVININMNKNLENNLRIYNIESTIGRFCNSNMFYFIKSLYFILQLKLKFVGKMYRIKKLGLSFGTIKSEFNCSHKNIFIPKDIVVKKIKKRKLIFMCNNLKLLKANSLFFKNIRSVNIFTKRGIRLSKQILLKKTGKVSTYR
jgi:hypothetical protein